MYIYVYDPKQQSNIHMWAFKSTKEKNTVVAMVLDIKWKHVLTMPIFPPILYLYKSNNAMVLINFLDNIR